MLNTSLAPWPSYSEDEIDAVADVLRSNRVNSWTGDHTHLFEEEFARYTGAKHALALSNGTVAIDLALRFSVSAGDHVIVTPRSFIASVSSVVQAGCVPVFADVDPHTQNITAETIGRVITKHTSAIVVVHLAGMPADMDSIMELAAQHNLVVIEDCAQAHGALYKGRSVGTIGHFGTWSFCQDKIITTGGEGGMVTLNDSETYHAMWSFKDHGKSWDVIHKNEAVSRSGFRWLHDSFGTNWRMTEMQSVLGRLQLKKLKDWQATRLSNAERIWATCRDFQWLKVPTIPAYATHAAYKAYVFVDNDALPSGWDRDAIIRKILARDIPVYSGSCAEIYMEKAFDGTGFRPENRLPIARELGEQSLMFLCHPTLTEQDIDRVCSVLQDVNELVETAQNARLICG